MKKKFTGSEGTQSTWTFMKAQLHVGFGSTLFLSKFITIYKLLKMQRQDTCISAFIINVCTCIFEVNLSVLSQRVMAYKEDRDICRPFNLAIGCLQLKTWLYREFSFHPTLCSHIFFSNSIADLKKTDWHRLKQNFFLRVLLFEFLNSFHIDHIEINSSAWS